MSSIFLLTLIGVFLIFIHIFIADFCSKLVYHLYPEYRGMCLLKDTCVSPANSKVS